ncbi:MAG: ROK family protein [Verrucomicrobia bacterium]|jgi:glucokinase|nr:ROK family protein [Verrucomicrobiota bacterium]
MADGKEYFVGVDLGGTKILAAVFSPALKCLGKSKRSTKAERGAQAVIDRIARCVSDAVDECDLDLKLCRGVGIGAPGAVDFEAGKVVFAPNLDWKDLPLKKELEKRLEVPVFLDNDCNVCSLGVYEKELGAKPASMVGMFIGTGIGGGLVLEGKPYSGMSHTAGEIGHMVVQVDGPKCGCGRKGCLEAVASRTAMFKRLQTAVKDGEKTELTDIVGEDLSDLKSSHLRKALKRGDKLVKRTIEDAARYIGIGAANLINILNPEYVVLGGGVIDALEDEMFGAIVESAREHTFPGADRGLKIVASKLGDDAGITGAAVLARRCAK